MNRDEADRSLKVLNSNLINLVTNASDKPELEALHFLLTEPSSPIYLLRTNSLFLADSVKKLSDRNKGKFNWDQDRKTFVRKDGSDNLELNFSVGKQMDVNAEFVINDYKSEDCNNHIGFPVLMDAKILIEKLDKLTIAHHAVIKDHFPLEIKSLIKGVDYQFELNLHRTRDGNKGSIQMDFNILANGYIICSADIKTKIEYTKDGYYFTYFDFEIELIDHQIKGKIDYAKIDPTAGNYIDLFNEYSEIIISEVYGKKVGNIVLGLSGDGELLDYFINFNNGEKILLSNYIPLIKKVLDYKY